MKNVSSLVALKATVSLLLLIVLIATKLSFRNEVRLIEIQKGNVDEAIFGKFAFPLLATRIVFLHEWLAVTALSAGESCTWSSYTVLLYTYTQPTDSSHKRASRDPQERTEITSRTARWFEFYDP
jgi:hypothetical protein